MTGDEGGKKRFPSVDAASAALRGRLHHLRSTKKSQRGMVSLVRSAAQPSPPPPEQTAADPEEKRPDTRPEEVKAAHQEDPPFPDPVRPPTHEEERLSNKWTPDPIDIPAAAAHPVSLKEDNMEPKSDADLAQDLAKFAEEQAYLTESQRLALHLQRLSENGAQPPSPESKPDAPAPADQAPADQGKPNPAYAKGPTLTWTHTPPVNRLAARRAHHDEPQPPSPSPPLNNPPNRTEALLEELAENERDRKRREALGKAKEKDDAAWSSFTKFFSVLALGGLLLGLPLLGTALTFLSGFPMLAGVLGAGAVAGGGYALYRNPSIAGVVLGGVALGGSCALLGVLPTLGLLATGTAATAAGVGAQKVQNNLQARRAQKALEQNKAPPPGPGKARKLAISSLAALAVGGATGWGAHTLLSEDVAPQAPPRIKQTNILNPADISNQKASSSPLASAFEALGQPGTPVREAFATVRGKVYPMPSLVDLPQGKDGTTLSMVVPASNVAGEANILMCRAAKNGDKAQVMSYGALTIDVHGNYHIKPAVDMPTDTNQNCEANLRKGVERFYSPTAAQSMRRVLAPAVR